jgi:C4-dicarboxylate transporter DctQ subunit
MGLFGRLFDGILTATLYVVAVFLVVLVLSISYDVMMRYFLNRPTAWAYDLSNYLIYGITLLVAACVQKEEGHIRIDICISLFGPKTQAITNCVVSVLCAVFCGIFAWRGLEATWVSYIHRYPLTGGIKIPEFAILWLIPFGMFLLFIQFIRLSRSNIAGLSMLMTKKDRN